MTHYVVGFMFNPEMTQVALIRKNRPAWQKGLLNGIGGKIEGSEFAYEAMTREFHEEAGCYTSNWYSFCTMKGTNNDNSQFQIEFFFSLGNLSKIKSVTDEQIEIIDVSNWSHLKFVQNLSWLIPMAIDFGKGNHPPTKVMVEY